MSKKKDDNSIKGGMFQNIKDRLAWFKTDYKKKLEKEMDMIFGDRTFDDLHIFGFAYFTYKVS